MSSRLLPNNAQPYTRALADAHDTHGRLNACLGVIPLIGRTSTPTEWVPWILRNRGLEPLMQHVDWQTLLDRGSSWLRIRGTPRASVDVLGWVGWAVRFECGPVGTYLYDHYHIHLPDVPDRPALETIIAVEEFAKSSDSTFFRLVHGHDVRKVLSGHTRMGAHLWGRDSGVDVRPDWPRLSFRVRDGIRWQAHGRAIAGDALTISARAVRAGEVILGRSHLPSRADRGPTWGIALGDSLRVAADWRATAHDAIRPLAGVVGARSIIGRRQALHVALRQERGERPRLALHRTACVFRLPAVHVLMAVPDPLRLDGSAAAEPATHAAVTLAVSSRAGARRPVAGEPSAPAARALADMRPDRAIRLDARGGSGDAAWSSLPWSDAPFGAAPAARMDARLGTPAWTDAVAPRATAAMAAALPHLVALGESVAARPAAMQGVAGSLKAQATARLDDIAWTVAPYGDAPWGAFPAVAILISVGDD